MNIDFNKPWCILTQDIKDKELFDEWHVKTQDVRQNGDINYKKSHFHAHFGWYNENTIKHPEITWQDFLNHYFPEKSKFPEKWLIQTNEENHAIVTGWFDKNSQTGSSNYHAYNKGSFYYYPKIDSCHQNYDRFRNDDAYTLISFEDFKKNVLKEEFVFPKYWYTERRKEVEDWLNTQCDYKDWVSKYVGFVDNCTNPTFNGFGGWMEKPNLTKEYGWHRKEMTYVTFKQFSKEFLNKKDKPDFDISNWSIKITTENQEEVKNYFNNQKWDFSISYWNFSIGNYYGLFEGEPSSASRRNLITSEEFRKYVKKPMKVCDFKVEEAAPLYWCIRNIYPEVLEYLKITYNFTKDFSSWKYIGYSGSKYNNGINGAQSPECLSNKDYESTKEITIEEFRKWFQPLKESLVKESKYNNLINSNTIVIPGNWYITITNVNKSEFKEWFDDKSNSNIWNYSLGAKYGYSGRKLEACGLNGDKFNNIKEISYELFQKHILSNPNYPLGQEVHIAVLETDDFNQKNLYGNVVLKENQRDLMEFERVENLKFANYSMSLLPDFLQKPKLEKISPREPFRDEFGQIISLDHLDDYLESRYTNKLKIEAVIIPIKKLAK